MPDNYKPFPPMRDDESTTITGEEARRLNSYIYKMVRELNTRTPSPDALVEALQEAADQLQAQADYMQDILNQQHTMQPKEFPTLGGMTWLQYNCRLDECRIRQQAMQDKADRARNALEAWGK